jgi:hypothetical protein
VSPDGNDRSKLPVAVVASAESITTLPPLAPVSLGVPVVEVSV